MLRERVGGKGGLNENRRPGFAAQSHIVKVEYKRKIKVLLIEHREFPSYKPIDQAVQNLNDLHFQVKYDNRLTESDEQDLFDKINSARDKLISLGVEPLDFSW